MSDPHVPKGICSNVHMTDFIKKIRSDLLSGNGAEDTDVCVCVCVCVITCDLF